MLPKHVSTYLFLTMLVLASVACAAVPGITSSAAASTAANATQATTGPQGIPVFDPATNVTATDQVLNFTTTAGIDAVAQFYIDQMPKLGWSFVGDPYVADTVAKISFSKNGKIADIGIAVDDKSKQTSIGILVQ